MHPHIMILGLRSFPGVQGGVETHCAHLYPLLVDGGFRVTVIARSQYFAAGRPLCWKGIEFLPVWSPRSKLFEAPVHTLIGVFLARLNRPDVLHIHAIGPSSMVPLARLLGLTVVITHHGPDYNRQKWGWFAKLILRTSEALGVLFSHRRIVISDMIRTSLRCRYRRDSYLIRNGVTLPPTIESSGAPRSLGLESGRYVLMVGRLVPEKRQIDLINAFARARLRGWKLVLVGGADHPDAYSRALEEKAKSIPGVVMPGMQVGLALKELYTHAGLFVLPSSHEGMPIALLEALSYGLKVLASNIPANLEVGMPDENYFPVGDVNALAERLRFFSTRPVTAKEAAEVKQWIEAEYDWSKIACQTIAVYCSLPNVARKFAAVRSLLAKESQPVDLRASKYPLAGPRA